MVTRGVNTELKLYLVDQEKGQRRLQGLGGCQMPVKLIVQEGSGEGGGLVVYLMSSPKHLLGIISW